jgi:hypothetical protein
MIEYPDDLARRLRSYLRTYDGQAHVLLRRRPIHNGAHRWEWHATNRRARLLQASAVVAFTTAIFVLFAGAFALGRSGATTHASHGATGHPRVAATATPAATTCAILAQSADYDLYSISPDSSPAPVSCQAAIAAAESACPPTRPVCAGVAPQRAELSLLSGFGTVAYSPQFGGYRKEPVWLLSWPLDCSLAGPSMPGPKLGMVEQMPPTTSNGCGYVEFVSATNGAFLFSAATQSCYPWVGPADAASCDSPQQ